MMTTQVSPPATHYSYLDWVASAPTSSIRPGPALLGKTNPTSVMTPLGPGTHGGRGPHQRSANSLSRLWVLQDDFELWTVKLFCCVWSLGELEIAQCWMWWKDKDLLVILTLQLMTQLPLHSAWRQSWLLLRLLLTEEQEVPGLQS